MTPDILMKMPNGATWVIPESCWEHGTHAEINERILAGALTRIAIFDKEAAIMLFRETF